MNSVTHTSAKDAQSATPPAYSLLHEPWLSVRLASGTVTTLGLLESFERSREIVALAETVPPNLVAQYRLLLAITHRALSQKFGRWTEADRASWYRTGFPHDAVRAYLEQWQEHFWLFHPQHPFMQVAVLESSDKTRDKQKPWTQISLGSSNGNTPVVFDHAFDTQPAEITPAEAVNTLLGFLQFTPGGLVKVFRGSDKAGALANTAAVIPLGNNLAETLALCLHPPETRSDGWDDLPSWEREPLTESQLSGDPVFASGPNDRYTRQSRAVLLLRESNGNVRWLRFGAGMALADSEGQPDPMASFRAGQNGPVRITFSEGRAAWRDLPALVPGPTDENVNRRPAAVISYAASLHDELGVGSGDYQPLLVAGVAGEPGRPAKLVRWRMEQIALPANLLGDPDRSQLLKAMVGDADTVFRDLRWLAQRMLTESLPDPGHPDTRAKAQGLLAAGPLSPTYFAVAERALPDLMYQLGMGDFDAAEEHWAVTLRGAVFAAWRSVVAGLGSTPRGLRAEARYFPRLFGVLDKHGLKTDEVDNPPQTGVMS